MNLAGEHAKSNPSFSKERFKTQRANCSISDKENIDNSLTQRRLEALAGFDDAKLGAALGTTIEEESHGRESTDDQYSPGSLEPKLTLAK